MKSNKIILITCDTHGELTKKDVYFSHANNKFPRCRFCELIRRKKYYVRHRKKEIESTRRWERENPEKFRKLQRHVYHNKSKEQKILRRRNGQKTLRKAIDNLHDYYVKKILTLLKLPYELLEVKREQLKLKRKLREMKIERNSKA